MATNYPPAPPASGALSNFRESKEGLIVLEDVYTEVFDVFVDWIYEKTLPEKHFAQKADKDLVSFYHGAYILADRLMISEFKRALFDAIFDWYSRQKKYAGFATISFAFNNLPDDDPLLQLHIDTFCVNDALKRYNKNSKLEEILPNVPQRAFVRLFMKMHGIKDFTEEAKKLNRDAYDI